MPEAIVTYPGLQNIISFNYTRGHGISPGFVSITCTPQEEWPQRIGTINLEYDEFRLELPECVADNLSFTFDASGQLWQLMILDRRWKWRYGSISGRYNVRLPNGPVDKLDPRTEKNPRELIGLLLEAMGETDTIIGKLPEKLRPTIVWDHSNPAQELANLCDQFGMSIVLRDDNYVGIFPKGYGNSDGTLRTQLSGESVIADSGTVDPPELPSKVTFVCGPSRFQVDYPLDCVNDDIDGLIKHIRKLSYSPHQRDAGGNLGEAIDWSRGDIVSFSNVPLFNPGDSDGQNFYNYVSPRELARAGMYKKYQIRLIKVRAIGKGAVAEPYGAGYRIEGYRDALKRQTPDSKEFNDPYELFQILPMGAELVEPTFDTRTGWYRPLNCIVWGVYAPGGGIINNISLDDVVGFDESKWLGTNDDWRIPMLYRARDPENGQLLSSFQTTVIPPEEYSFDSDTGVFTFSRQTLRIAFTGLTERERREAILWARVAVTVCDHETRTPLREEVEFQINEIQGFESVEDLGTDTLIIRDDDIFLRVEPTYDPDNPHLSLNAPLDNLDFIKEYARERVTAEMRKYQTLGPRAITYAGWVKCDSAGDVMQVNYNLSAAGATTSISLNGEIAALTISYSERRFLEKIRNEKLDQAMQMYNRMAFEQGFAFSRLSNLTRTGR